MRQGWGKNGATLWGRMKQGWGRMKQGWGRTKQGCDRDW